MYNDIYIIIKSNKKITSKLENSFIIANKCKVAANYNNNKNISKLNKHFFFFFNKQLKLNK